MSVKRPSTYFSRLFFRITVSAIISVFVAGRVSNAWASSFGDERPVIADIVICMVAAAGMGWIMRFLRQPLILGHLLAGIAIGPLGLSLIHSRDAIGTISEIGLILLLFMIGLEIDLKKVFSSGWLVIVTGVVQFPIALGMSWLLFQGMDGLGLGLDDKHLALYAAMVTTLSSTMVVIKSLSMRNKSDKSAYRTSVGILISQDIFIIFMFAMQPNVGDFQVNNVLTAFCMSMALVFLTMMCSFYVLPRLFHLIAMIPELMMVIALAWCFLVAMVADSPQVSLSMGMGAFIAGVSLSAFSCHTIMIANIIFARDFLIALFMMAVGMQIPTPDTQLLAMTALLVGWMLGTRFLEVFLVQHFFPTDYRSKSVATINLSLVSKFSLVVLILALGLMSPHRDINTDTLSWRTKQIQPGYLHFRGSEE